MTRPLSLAALTDAAKKVGLLSYEALTKTTDPNRGANNPYERILATLADFPDDRAEKKFGNIGTWTNRRILIVDSLSELANACMKMVIGNKPTAAPPDYGVSQNNLLNLLRFLIPQYAQEGKAYLTIGIGCTGGRHRSVAIAEALAWSAIDTLTAGRVAFEPSVVRIPFVSVRSLIETGMPA